MMVIIMKTIRQYQQLELGLTVKSRQRYNFNNDKYVVRVEWWFEQLKKAVDNATAWSPPESATSKNSEIRTLAVVD